MQQNMNSISAKRWRKVRYVHVFYSLLYKNSFRKDDEESSETQEPEIKKTKCQRIGMNIYHICTSHLGLLVLLLLYTFMGAFIFQAIEGHGTGLTDAQKTEINREYFIENVLKNISSSSNGSLPSDVSIIIEAIRTELREYEKRMVEEGLMKISSSAHERWDYFCAVNYCLSVYTTIGYGDLYPITTAGRWITILYATLGIPLCLITLADLGLSFSKGLKYVYRKIRKRCSNSCHKKQASNEVSDSQPSDEEEAKSPLKQNSVEADSNYNKETAMAVINKLKQTRSTSVSSASLNNYMLVDEKATRVIQHCLTIKDPEMASLNEDKVEDDDIHSHVPVILPVLITLLYLLLGVILYSQYEGWDFTEAFYFTFISLSTIGFGDYVPRERYFILSTSYHLIGLALVAMTITFLMELTNATLGKAKHKVNVFAGRKLGFKIVQSVKNKNAQSTPHKHKHLSKTVTPLQNRKIKTQLSQYI